MLVKTADFGVRPSQVRAFCPNIGVLRKKYCEDVANKNGNLSGAEFVGLRV